MTIDPALVLAPIFLTTELLSMALCMAFASLRRSGLPGVWQWLVANCAVVIYLPLLGLRGMVPDSISIVLANGVQALSLAMYYAGCACFLGRPPRWRLLLGGAILQVLGVTYWRYVDNSLPMRVMAISIYAALVCLATAWLMVSHYRGHRRSVHYRLLTGLSCLLAVTQVVRAIYFYHLNPVPTSIMLASGWNIILLCLGAAIMPALSMSAVLILHESLQTQAEDAANRDFMTGALSRKHLFATGQQLILQAAATRRPLVLLLIDLDHFKNINDTFGHAAGDEVLCAFAGMVRGHLRSHDALGRLGGEEFAVLLPDTALDAAGQVAERLRLHAQQNPVSSRFGECRYSISIGVAAWQGGESFDQLCRRADQALYYAKNTGRNRVEVSLAGATTAAIAGHI
ncbi:GGDEF domain-containing protein [Aquitalea sp. LB_tupeE]|uniref:GGDEF domain-containing protein n=1 Tax=Aquitalea sp. LB_tupeE TaxID=2748078 RepID=UPI0015C13004|nr:GGDEF domain-containing protein [Aquitalea sp. LB_tupeE]NWK79288.1 GGDEF domain-containing protein [Aquitalea sp. LB_tupeE]